MSSQKRANGTRKSSECCPRRQIADMEKDGAEVDLDPAAAAMREYAQAGLDTFDMADHCELPAALRATYPY